MSKTETTPPDISAVWRDWATQSERQWNEFFNEMMGTDEFSQSLGRNLDVFLHFQKTMSEAMGPYLTALERAHPHRRADPRRPPAGDRESAGRDRGEPLRAAGQPGEGRKRSAQPEAGAHQTGRNTACSTACNAGYRLSVQPRAPLTPA